MSAPGPIQLSVISDKMGKKEYARLINTTADIRLSIRRALRGEPGFAGLSGFRVTPGMTAKADLLSKFAVAITAGT